MFKIIEFSVEHNDIKALQDQLNKQQGELISFHFVEKRESTKLNQMDKRIILQVYYYIAIFKLSGPTFEFRSVM